MPSLHAANAFAVATLITALVPRAGRVTYPVAALIALSRVGVGVHWPSDVAVGSLFGLTVGATIAVVFRLTLPAHTHVTQ
jgi:undecaprenyl-diphosphatase